MRFTLRLALAIVAAIFATVVLSPLVAWVVAAAGFRYPLPRIFDRVVMASVAVALVLFARQLGLGGLLRSGFAGPRRNLGSAFRGIAVAFAAMAVLVLLAWLARGGRPPDWGSIATNLPRWLMTAVTVALIEESFFRAILLGGMQREIGATRALVVSSIIYAGAHLVRAPDKYYVTSFEPAAGLHNLVASASQLAGVEAAVPAFIGLFILGLVLGRAYQLTGNLYFSMGLHAGIIVGLRVWSKCVWRAKLPFWVGGDLDTPVISGIAAWAIALTMLATLPYLLGERSRDCDALKSRA
ncbi:MAG: lysostaphin resistance A-like protein [Candidatus Binataceae bacterium]